MSRDHTCMTQHTTLSPDRFKQAPVAPLPFTLESQSRGDGGGVACRCDQARQNSSDHISHLRSDLIRSMVDRSRSFLPFHRVRNVPSGSGLPSPASAVLGLDE
jgi:hypothetical protein